MIISDVQQLIVYIPQIYFLAIKLARQGFCLKYGRLILLVKDIIFESVEKRGFSSGSIPYDTEFFVDCVTICHHCVEW